MNTDKKWLVILTFSPVQGFISASRKTKDLFMSSFLLSFLTEKLIEKHKKELKVIYPAQTNGQKGELLANYPNRLVATYKGTEEQVKDLIKKAKESFNEEIDKIAKETCKLIIEEATRCENAQLLDLKTLVDQTVSHVKRYFSFYAAAFSLSNDYQNDYETTERILGARKTFRPYGGAVDLSNYEEEFPNGCTTCGERLHLALPKEAWSDYDKLGTSEKECLCGLCLAKRNLGKVYLYGELEIKDRELIEHFPSTHEIALAKEKIELLQKMPPEVKTELENLAGALIKALAPEGAKTYPVNRCVKEAYEDFSELLSVSAEFYSTNYLYELIKDERLAKHKDLLKSWLDALEKLPKELEALTNRAPYFALLMSDGDNIGKILGGDENLIKKTFGEEFHREFSEKLSEYASKMRRFAEEEGGRCRFVRTVYAGGDDFFAFSHLSELIRLLELVSAKYKEVLSELLTEPTVSAGAVIAHAKVNLQFLLQKTREAEKEAKNRWGRNAFVVKVVSRSGEETSFGAKYAYGQLKPLELLARVVELYKEEKASSKLPYALREFVRYLNKDDSDEVALLLIERELRRKISDEAKEELIEQTKALFEAQTKEHKLKPSKALKNLSALFFVGRFLGGRGWSSS